MARILFACLVVALSAVIIVSFFQPWVRAKVNVTKVATGLVDKAQALQDAPFAGKFIKHFTAATNAIGALGDIEIKTQVSGYDIPTLINKKSSTVAISLVQVMAKDVKDLDKKSLMVYMLPMFAIVCIVLAVLGLKNKLAVIPIAVISVTISMSGLYNIFTADFSKLPVQITIMNGLWQTMYSYLLIFVVSAAWFFMVKYHKKNNQKRV